MSELRPDPFTPPPPVVPALRTLANHMRRVAVELRVSGTPAAGTRGAKLAGSALLAEAWADEIEADARL